MRAWTGLADKSVGLVYERVLHEQVSRRWVGHCIEQMSAVMGALEADRASRTAPFWFGGAISHADIAVACAIRSTAEAHPQWFALSNWPALAEQIARCEALEPFQAIAQPFQPP